MKTTDPRDPLDQQIDALLSNRPVQPSDDFASRVLNAAQATTNTSVKKKGKLAPILHFTLPIAAAIAIALIVAPLIKQSEPSPVTNIAATPPQAPVTTDSELLGDIGTQEIFLLEEGLSGLTAQLESDNNLNSDALLETLDALFLEIES